MNICNCLIWCILTKAGGHQQSVKLNITRKFRDPAYDRYCWWGLDKYR